MILNQILALDAVQELNYCLDFDLPKDGHSSFERQLWISLEVVKVEDLMHQILHMKSKYNSYNYCHYTANMNSSCLCRYQNLFYFSFCEER